jgi:uncharacterized protein
MHTFGSIGASAISTVLWDNPHDRSTDLCRLVESERGFVLEGVVLIAASGHPALVDYRVETDRDWVTSQAHLRLTSPGEAREVSLSRDGRGRWTVDGERRDELDGCVDVDLGVTPATNALPIRRLFPAVNEIAEVRAAWVGFPGLEVVPSTQSYERLGDRAYRFRSGDFVADLVVDHAGLVLRYGDDYWTALAHTVGP